MSKSAVMLNRKSAGLVVIDIQEKLNAVMSEKEAVLKAAITLIKGCKLLGIPIFYTEQYPEGLGPTEPALRELLQDVSPKTKIFFSCCRDTNLVIELRTADVNQVILAGMETHICVQQTAFDLTLNNFQIFLAREAVTSRKELDRDLALERMRQAGVYITSVESILFELLESADAPEFRRVQKLIK